jgi:hypothetical protein
MKYTVLWIPNAERELADLWVDSGDRGAIAGAANEIDRLLRIDPSHAGESRSHGRRILLVPPLGVTYEILEDDRLVRVLDVWRF